MYILLFLGTSAFAVPSLRALKEDGRFEIAGIITQPDKPVGRHATLTPPAVKVAAKELGISEIQQPAKLKEEDFKKWVEDIGPSCDAFVVVSYGKILPSWMLELPKHGIFNVHGSLLPRWRGPSPIQAAILAGDDRTGVTIMKINEKMDEGPILLEEQTAIHPDETGGELHDRLANLGATVLPHTLAAYLDEKLEPKEQNGSKATYCKILTRNDGRLDWAKTADELARMVRAYHPWPGTWTIVNETRLKVVKARAFQYEKLLKPGTPFVHDGLPCIAATSGTALELVEVQPEGKKAMSGNEFLRGMRSFLRN